MGTTTASVDVNRPIDMVYHQWTQFESFPGFVEGVERIDQLDDTHLHWIKVGPATREFDAIITEQHPEERVAWKSDSGPDHAGVVTFHRLDDESARVTTQVCRRSGNSAGVSVRIPPGCLSGNSATGGPRV